MSTDPQSPQGSPSEARGSQSHPHPVSEGRQSPGLAAAVTIPRWAADLAVAAINLAQDPSATMVKARGVIGAALAAPGTPQGGGAATIRKALESALAGVWDGHYSGTGVTVGYAQAVDKEVKEALALLSATPSQEEGPAGVDLEALDILERIQWNGALVGNNCPSCGGHSAYGHTEKCKLAKLIASLRAQAPASSPRDLEAARKSIDVIIGCYEDMAFHAGKEGFNEAQRSYEIARDAVEKKLAAHPPKGETPSEAARVEDVEAVDKAMAGWKRHMGGGNLFSVGAWERIKSSLRAPGTPIEKAAREYVTAAKKLRTANFLDMEPDEKFDLQVAEETALENLFASLDGCQ